MRKYKTSVLIGLIVLTLAFTFFIEYFKAYAIVAYAIIIILGTLLILITRRPMI